MPGGGSGSQRAPAAQADGSRLPDDAVRAPRVCLLDATTLPPLAGNANRYRQAGLSEEEIRSAEGFRHPMARACHLGARLLARSSLAALLGCQPHELEFTTGEFGKPEVRGSAGAAGWHFNLSHGGHLVACATARHPVGIDVEPRTREIDPLPIAQAHFSAAEAAWLATFPMRSRDRFLALWTLKEAYVKGRGVGLSAPLSSLRIRPRGARGFAVHADDDRPSPWHARLHCIRGHWLSLATPDPAGRPSMTWSDTL